MNIRSTLVRNLLAGLAVVLPIIIVVFLARRLVGIGAGIIDWLFILPDTLGLASPLRVVVAGGVLLALVAGLIALGIVARNRLGELVIGLVDSVIEGLPLVGPVYRGLREARTALVDRDSDRFDDVVLVELATDVHALAFVVSPARSEFQDTLGTDDLVAVYVPLSPNPTLGGHMLFVDEDRIVETSLGVRQALTAIITLGAAESRRDDPPLSGVYQTQTPDRSSSQSDETTDTR